MACVHAILVAGPVQGGTQIVVRARRLQDTGQVLCRFGNRLVVHARLIDLAHCICVSPAAAHQKQVMLSVSLNGQQFQGDLHFDYHAKVVLHALQPTKVSEGMLRTSLRP